jgi:hypothetical protein
MRHRTSRFQRDDEHCIAVGLESLVSRRIPIGLDVD